jgi:hypothetical protein
VRPEGGELRKVNRKKPSLFIRETHREGTLRMHATVIERLRSTRSRRGGKRRVYQGTLSGFPFYRFIEYPRPRAVWTGVMAIEMSEVCASKTCHDCCAKGFILSCYLPPSDCSQACDADCELPCPNGQGFLLPRPDSIPTPLREGYGGLGLHRRIFPAHRGYS